MPAIRRHLCAFSRGFRAARAPYFATGTSTSSSLMGLMQQGRAESSRMMQNAPQALLLALMLLRGLQTWRHDKAGGLGGAPLMLFMPWGGERGRQRAAIRAAATRCTLFLACCRPFFHPPAWPREQPPGTTASAPAFFLWQVHSPQSSSTQAPCLEETAVARSAVTHSAGALSTDARSTVAPSAVARSVGSRSAVACVAVAVQSGRVPLRHALPRRAPFDGDGLVGGAHSTMMRSAVARLAVGAFGQGALCRGTLGRNGFGCDAFGRGTCGPKRNHRLFARV